MNYIESMEKKVVSKMLENGCIPIPRESEWKSIQEKYNLPDFEQVDDVLCRLKFPPGWKIIQKEYPENRFCDIFNEEGFSISFSFSGK